MRIHVVGARGATTTDATAMHPRNTLQSSVVQNNVILAPIYACQKLIITVDVQPRIS